jgi:hypothetical protein
MVQRLLCWAGWHVAPRVLGATRAIYWACCGCGQLVPGELTARRHR